MRHFPTSRRGIALFTRLICFVIGAAAHCSAMAYDQPVAEPAPYAAPADIRHGGVLAESFGYHRQAPPPATITPPDGWYQYGFPVSTHRWGWFGAERYYPRVTWHRGYNGDFVRWGYRYGY